MPAAVPGPLRDPHTGKFRNAQPARMPSIAPVLWAMLTERAVREPTAPLPVERRTIEDFAAPPASGLRITWLGHSTLFVEIEQRRFLVDPVWAERASPWEWLGPRRFHPPPVALDELPALDAVLLSHNQYDHLHEATVRALAARGTPFVVPTGVKALLMGWGIAGGQVREVSWWDELEFCDVRVTATPSRHFSGRSPLTTDRDRSLWCGFAFAGRERRAWYAGDTSMFDGFRAIGEALGPFDVSCIEIGAYSHFWPDVHIGPELAIEAHVMAKGGLFLPVHWGTFNLALHGWTEPIERAIVAAERAGVRIVTPRPGGMIDPLAPPPVERWWPSIPWRTVEEYPIVGAR